MDVAIITLVVLLAVWYVGRHFRATLKEKEHPCSDCDGTTCKQTAKHDCQEEQDRV